MLKLVLFNKILCYNKIKEKFFKGGKRVTLFINMKYNYKTNSVCSREINFDINGNVITNISFVGGCNGNLKALSKVLDGYTVEEIENKLKGNTCGFRSTSCADQLSIAVRKAYNEINK